MFQLPFLDQIKGLITTTVIDDHTDAISSLISAGLYLFCAILISAKVYVGSPIQCWLPQTYSGQWAEYAETYCFLKSTYFVAKNDTMPARMDRQDTVRFLSYYQWSSVYLTVMGLSFILPKIIWRKSQEATDISLMYFCETTHQIKTETKEKRKEKVSEMSDFLEEKLKAKHPSKNLSKLPLSVAWIITKSLYVANLFFQFWFLSTFLGQGFDVMWAFKVVNKLFHGVSWEITGLFPRITYCDFDVRQVSGKLEHMTIQCVLGVNEFNEKIFIFIWFWLVFAAPAAIIGYGWTYYHIERKHFIKSLLQSHDNSSINYSKCFETFGKRYLGRDGRLILSYIKDQSELVAQEVSADLFEKFLKEEASEKNGNMSRIKIHPQSEKPRDLAIDMDQ